MYAEAAGDVLVFQSSPTGMQLLATDFSRQWPSEIEREFPEPGAAGLGSGQAQGQTEDFYRIHVNGLACLCRLSGEAEQHSWVPWRSDRRALLSPNHDVVEEGK
jgi:hypothetical protein